MSEQYVPTMERLRSEHVWLSGGENPGAREAAGEDFDAAIAAHDREVETRALRRAADEIADLYFGPDQGTPFTRGSAHKWGSDTAAARLRARADRIESQETP